MAIGGHTRSFGRDVRGASANDVSEDLPTDRRIGIEQPVEDFGVDGVAGLHCMRRVIARPARRQRRNARARPAVVTTDGSDH